MIQHESVVDVLGVVAEAEPGLSGDFVPAADILDPVLAVTALDSAAKRPAVPCQKLWCKEIHTKGYHAYETVLEDPQCHLLPLRQFVLRLLISIRAVLVRVQRLGGRSETLDQFLD